MPETPRSELPPPPSELPAWGQLLLLTQLAKHHPLLGVRYFGTPDVLHAPNGDVWSARREEDHVVDERSPDRFRFEEARAQTLHLQGELASALRAKSPRVAALRAQIKAYEPRLVPPESTVWRVPVEGSGLD